MGADMGRTFSRGALAGLLATALTGFGGAAWSEALTFATPEAATRRRDQRRWKRRTAPR